MAPGGVTQAIADRARRTIAERLDPRWVPPLVAAVVAVQLAAVSSLDWLRTPATTLRWPGLLGVATLLALDVGGSDGDGSGRRTLRPARLGWTLLVVIAGASTAWSVAPRTGFLRSIAFAAVLWIATSAGRSMVMHGTLMRFLRCIAALTGTALAASLARWLVDAENATYVDELRGIVENANGLSMLVALLLVTSVVLLDQRGPSLLPVALMVPAGVLFGLTAGRTGLLLALISLASYELAGGRRNRMAAALAVLVAVSAAVSLWRPEISPDEPLRRRVAAADETDLGDQAAGGEGPAEQEAVVDDEPRATVFGTDRALGQSFVRAVTGARDEAWDHAVDIAAERPVLGHGFGTGDLLYERYDVKFLFYQGANPGNSYIQTAMELGVVGLAVLVLIAAQAARAAIRTLRRRPSPDLAVLAGLTIGAFAVAVVESTLLAGGAPWALLAWVPAGAVLAAE